MRHAPLNRLEAAAGRAHNGAESHEEASRGITLGELCFGFVFTSPSFGSTFPPQLRFSCSWGYFFAVAVAPTNTMANSGLQLLGFLLSLLGLLTTVAATFMVEWKKQFQGKTHRIYEGLWMTCSGNERTTCEHHHSLLKLPSKRLPLFVGSLSPDKTNLLAYTINKSEGCI